MQSVSSSGLSEMTGEHCEKTLRRLREALAVAGIELDRMVLWHDLADVRWIAAFPGAVLRPDGGACLLDRQRTVNGFRDAVFVKRTVMAIENAAGLPGFDAVVKHLRNWRLHPPVRQWNKRLLDLADQSGDHLYEIEIAARLSPTVAGLRFDEPDLLCENPEYSFRFGIACKRPRTPSGFMRCVRKAISQVRKEGALGVALVSVDQLIDQAVRDRSGRDLKAECVRRIGRVIEAHHGEVLAAMADHPPVLDVDHPLDASGFLGVIVTGSYLMMGRDGPNGPEFMNTAFVPVTVNKPEPRWAFESLWTLIHLIERGENSLIAMQ